MVDDQFSGRFRASCLDADSVLALVDGRMEHAARSEATTHLLVCQVCSDLVAAAADGDPGRPIPATTQRPPEARLSPGAALGRYVILDLVGRGGMSEVYAAYDRRLDRRVALKLMHERPPSGVSEATARARLLREAKAIARLSHPNVVVVYDAGEIDGWFFLAMEFIEGETLATWLAAAPRGWREIRQVFASAGRGLAAAHAVGLVHRDFKPQNVMVGRDGVVRVMDFGLARDWNAQEDGDAPIVSASLAPDSALTAHTLALTRFGALIGTPLYMAPEQFRIEPADGRTDQFGFCVALYQALYGERPFPSDSLATLKEAVMQGAVRDPPQGSRVASWLRSLLLRGLQPNRADRFPSMEALLTALDRDPARAIRRIAPILALGVVLAAGGLLLRHSNNRDEAMCRGAGERVAGIWEPPDAKVSPRRAAIDAAFLASGRPYAAGTSERVSQLLDHYAAEWSGMYTEACEATNVRRDQSEAMLDLRMTCLQHRLLGLRALTDLFATADGAVVDKAVDAVFALAPIDACADSRSLQAAVVPPDPAIRARVEELRQRLAEAKALSDAGRIREAIARSGPLVDAARALGYGPLIAEAQLESALAEQYYRPEAEAAYWKALFEGEANGQDEVVATAAVLLQYVLASKGADSDAWRLDQLAEAALRRIGGHPLLWVWLLASRGALLVDEGHPSEGLKAANESATLAARTLGRDHRDFGIATIATALALDGVGRSADALVAIDSALAILHRLYGPESPFLAIPLNDRGEILNALGRYSDARTEFQHALERWSADLGPDHPFLAFALTGLGQSFQAEGRSREAVPLLERAVKLRTINSTQVGRLQDSQLALAQALWDAGGDRGRALSLAREAQMGYAAVPWLAPKMKGAADWLGRHSHHVAASSLGRTRARSEPAGSSRLSRGRRGGPVPPRSGT